MRIQGLIGVKGVRQKGYIIDMKYHNNIPKSIKSVQEFRVKVLDHKNTYGMDSAIDAFGVSRSTIYLWESKLKQARGRIYALNPTSTRPKHVRCSRIDYRLIDELARLRNMPNCSHFGKGKLKPLLDEYSVEHSLPKISESSIGRCIAHLKRTGKIKEYRRLTWDVGRNVLRDYSFHRKKPKLRRGDYYPEAAGELLQIDCVMKLQNGVRRYIISAIDYLSAFAYSYAYKELNSTNSSDFLDKLITVAPFTITHVQTDNGLEFHRHFDDKLTKLDIVHFWNYAHKPIYNGKIERYNRTVQEEFIDSNLDLLFGNLTRFNTELTDWLIFYNMERPHYTHRDPISRSQISPLKAFVYMLKLDQEKSNMLWTHTILLP